jgi:DNA invertase Pin-like site-specific DNA recombinase
MRWNGTPSIAIQVAAEFEADIRHERQMEGIAKAKANGVKFGRQARLSPDDIAQMKARRKKGALIKDLQRDYKLSKAHVYRLLAA